MGFFLYISISLYPSLCLYVSFTCWIVCLRSTPPPLSWCPSLGCKFDVWYCPHYFSPTHTHTHTHTQREEIFEKKNKWINCIRSVPGNSTPLTSDLTSIAQRTTWLRHVIWFVTLQRAIGRQYLPSVVFFIVRFHALVFHLRSRPKIWSQSQVILSMSESFLLIDPVSSLGCWRRWTVGHFTCFLVHFLFRVLPIGIYK